MRTAIIHTCHQQKISIWRSSVRCLVSWLYLADDMTGQTAQIPLKGDTVTPHQLCPQQRSQVPWQPCHVVSSSVRGHISCLHQLLLRSQPNCIKILISFLHNNGGHMEVEMDLRCGRSSPSTRPANAIVTLLCSCRPKPDVFDPSFINTSCLVFVLCIQVLYIFIHVHFTYELLLQHYLQFSLT